MNHTAEQIAEQLPQSSLENAGELAEGAVANFADGIISGIDEADYEDADGSFIELNRAINYALKKESGQPVDDLELTKPYMRARKDFALAVIGNLGARFAAADDAQDMEAVETLAEKLETSLLGGAPNILNYVGDFDDSLDVAVAAQEVPVLRRATWEITEHAMQRITFASDPEAWSQSLEDKVLQASPIRQLQLLKFYESMSQHATAAGYGEEAAHILLAIFEDISQSGTALTGLVAAGYAVDVEDRFMNQRALTGNACTEITQWEKYGLSQYFQLPENIAGLYSVAHIARDTLGLRDQWGTIRSLAKMPDIPQELSGDRLVLSNVMQWFDHAHPEATVPNRATVDWLTRNLEDESIKQAISHAHTGSERLDVINQASGKSIAQPRSVTDIEPLGKVVGEQGIKNLPSEEATALLQTIHQPEVREMLEDFLGISLAELNLQSQLYLLQYVVERSPAEFSRLTHAAERLGGGASSIYWSNVGVSERKTYVSSTEFQPVSRVDFYEAFLATEFGEDLGDTIIGIAEKATPTESQQIMQMVTGYRQKARRFAGWFSEIDPEFSRSVEQSFNERLSELLVAGLEVAKHGQLDTAILHEGQRIQLKDMATYLNVLETFNQAFSDMTDTVEQGQVQKITADSAKGFSMYRFMPPKTDGKQVSLYIRPEGAYGFDSDMEYGRPGEGVEASISFVVNPVPGQAYLGARKSEKTQDLSIRFDREGVPQRGLDEGEKRDPTIAEGTISLDIGSILGNDKNLGTIIGRTIGAGNKLRAAAKGQAVAFNHSKSHFDQTVYGSSKGFAALAEHVQAMAEARIAAQRRQSLGKTSVQAAV